MFIEVNWKSSSHSGTDVVNTDHIVCVSSASGRAAVIITAQEDGRPAHIPITPEEAARIRQILLSLNK